MGQLWSSTSAPSPPDLVKLNDSMYEIYKPEKGEPNMEIVFFHGLLLTESRDTYWSTWMSTTDMGQTFWPQEWLTKKFPQARIVCASYDTCPFLSATTGRQDMHAIGESILAGFIHIESVDLRKPLVFVGHSVGGIVIKQVILEAFRQTCLRTEDDYRMVKLVTFLRSIKGVFFFSTPHRDSRLSDLASCIPYGYKGLSPMMEKISGIDAKRRNEEFKSWRSHRQDGVKAFSVGEMHETVSPRGFFLRPKSFIVPADSARDDTDGYLAVPGNHFDVAQPKSPVDSSFLALTQFISAVTGIPISTFEVDAYKVATGLPVERPEGFRSRRGRPRPRGPDRVTGIPVRHYEEVAGRGSYVRIDVPEDPRAFFAQYESGTSNEENPYQDSALL